MAELAAALGAPGIRVGRSHAARARPNGIALSPDEKTLYIVLQSPLSNPTRLAGDASRNTRVFAFDLASERMVAEYVYRFDVATEFQPDKDPPNLPSEMKLSS